MKAQLTRLLELRYRISIQLYLALGGAVLVTFAASLVGWFSFNQVGDAQTRVNEGSVPELAAAFGVAQSSGALVAAADALTAATTADEVTLVGDRISEAHDSFQEQLAVLETQGSDRAQAAPQGADARFARIRAHSTTLIDNIAGINSGVWYSFTLTDQSKDLRAELESLQFRLNAIMVREMDDQLFYAMTGYRKLGQPPAAMSAHLSEAELARYRYLTELEANANVATQLLATAFTVPETSLIEPLRERFESSAGHISRNLSHLEGADLHDELAPVLGELLELGTGPQNGFDLRAQELELDAEQRALLLANQGIAVQLVDEVDVLVSSARSGAQSATDAAGQAILTGRWLLLAISGTSIVGALLIAWLYVGRVILRRLGLLSGWMRQMAGGDLEAQVEMTGRDEVADMAAALEIFRRHALEVQRLNLVEELAEELQGKNDELEQALEDLHTAQDRIVVQQKLAALGELTAGVAHEIRNPLNFVKNFSESSKELLEEMEETLDEVEDGKLDDEQQGLLKDIFGDLSENMERILTHGDRANRIVQGMLMMGRESVGQQPTDLNALLDEHARLAYHSTRAQDSDFQLDLQYDFDESLGEIPANPQDLGRVFINMVSNACYATDEKRKQLVEQGQEDGYMPTLWLSTKSDGEQVEVRIRDNGTGMPPDVVEKIFNPFFTTKPTDKGTGLGLAISSDIVRQHGGAIEVHTEPGQYTEMVIGLPLPTSTLEDIPGNGSGSGNGYAADDDDDDDLPDDD